MYGGFIFAAVHTGKALDEATSALTRAINSLLITGTASALPAAFLLFSFVCLVSGASLSAIHPAGKPSNRSHSVGLTCLHWSD